VTATAEDAVRAIDEAFGRHEGHRVVHAKGVLCKGTFKATGAAAGLTRAAHLQAGAEVPATVRFSNGAGDPHASDLAAQALGMATKLYLPDGSKTDVVAITLPCFFVRTPEDFVAFTRAGKPAFRGQPGPRMALFLARHRESWRAVRAALGFKPPVSYATCVYRALHAFRWLDASGSERFVRYTWVPEAGEESLSREQAKERGRDYLAEEIEPRLSAGTVRFTLQVEIAAPGDPTHDATAVWPDDRERVDVGTLTLDGLETGREGPGDVLVFDPTRVIDGVELGDDPLPLLRSRAYSISVERRSGVARPDELG
jgi:catalase